MSSVECRHGYGFRFCTASADGQIQLFTSDLVESVELDVSRNRRLIDAVLVFIKKRRSSTTA